MFSSSLFVTLLLVASSTAVNKLSCYVCNSEANPSCGDPIKTGDGGLQAQVCNSDFTDAALNTFNAVSKGVSNILGLEKPPVANFACFKASYTVKAGDAEKKVVQRGCTLENAKICDVIKEKQKDTEMFCDECSSDECNGSSALHAAAFVLVPAVALLLATR
ncbi:uncharacterized protein [Halyomorpha halys]|uniref:uncharacterized protein n=1 Tax=Halyomorpha halys TaxID=286706 RepID=UPI0006D4C849|nr:uncharacterized protein LOC106677406 [Halyomorpha halys]